MTITSSFQVAIYTRITMENDGANDLAHSPRDSLLEGPFPAVIFWTPQEQML
jgi:hypothetical protein